MGVRRAMHANVNRLGDNAYHPHKAFGGWVDDGVFLHPPYTMRSYTVC